MAFSEAASRYLADRLAHLAERSVQTERERLKPLRSYFGATLLTRISVEEIRAYIAHRKAAGVANKTVNLELELVRGILKRAKRWHIIADDIKPLPVRRDIGRALSYEEKVRLLKAATQKPRWQNARLAMILALNTTMRSCEIRGLRWRQVNFIDRAITVRRNTTKTDAGQRVIPLNGDAWSAILELRERAKLFGGTGLDHYVFPACEHFRFDPTRPQKSWRSAWRSMRKAAGLLSFRFHDTRHHAVTELAESPASDQTIMSITGHVSRQMLEHYSHVRMEAKRRALEALSSRPSETPKRADGRGSYGTNHVTTDLPAPVLDDVTYSKEWSGREDLNLRPPGPEPGALPG